MELHDWHACCVADALTDGETESKSESNTQPDSESKSESNTQPDSESKSESNAQPNKSDSDDHSESDSKPGAALDKLNAQPGSGAQSDTTLLEEKSRSL